MEKMVRVMATGVFDILHPGHVMFLKAAKKYGDELVVVVARDITAERLKHRPIMREEDRRFMVDSLKPVDKAVLGYEDDMFRVVEELKPDIIVLGYDQKFQESAIEEECKKRGLSVKVVRLNKFGDGDIHGTRKIISKIVKRSDTLYAKNRHS